MEQEQKNNEDRIYKKRTLNLQLATALTNVRNRQKGKIYNISKQGQFDHRSSVMSSSYKYKINVTL